MAGTGRKGVGLDDGSDRLDDTAFVACRPLGGIGRGPVRMLGQRQSAEIAATLAICRLSIGIEHRSAGAVPPKHRRRGVSN